MAVKTLHIYPADGAWAVKKEGRRAKTFATQGEAVAAARKNVKRETGQFVIHGKNGQIREYEAYGLTQIQDPPKKSRLAKRIGQAVGRVALNRVQTDPDPSRVHTSKK